MRYIALVELFFFSFCLFQFAGDVWVTPPHGSLGRSTSSTPHDFFLFFFATFESVVQTQIPTLSRSVSLDQIDSTALSTHKYTSLKGPQTRS